MVSDRLVRLSHTVLFTLVLLSSIVALAISASLVSHYNNTGYPAVHTGAYRDRIRILLTAGVWSTAIALILIPGFLFLGHNPIFGLLSHIVPVAIGFILFIIGSASLTALTNGLDCGRAEGRFDRCNIVKGLVIISWIDTIFLFITLIFVGFLAVVAHRRAISGFRKGTLYAE